MTRRGVLVAFEGGDGCGKSTQSKMLAERLDALLTRQAGGTDFGLKVRTLTLDPATAGISKRAEALLYMADRAEHVDSLVLPTLESGRHVVSDRWAYSTLAYQGFGQGLDVDELRKVSDWAMAGLWPDVVIFLEVPVAEGARRRAVRDGAVDHYEAAGSDFHERVMEGYRSLADADPRTWKRIDASGSIDEVHEAVYQAVRPVLEK